MQLYSTVTDDVTGGSSNIATTPTSTNQQVDYWRQVALLKKLEDFHYGPQKEKCDRYCCWSLDTKGSSKKNFDLEQQWKRSSLSYPIHDGWAWQICSSRTDAFWEIGEFCIPQQKPFALLPFLLSSNALGIYNSLMPILVVYSMTATTASSRILWKLKYSW